MPLFNSETRDRRATLREARQRLAATDTESDASLAANSAVIAAGAPLAWWQRVDIDAGVYDNQAAADAPDDNY